MDEKLKTDPKHALNKGLLEVNPLRVVHRKKSVPALTGFLWTAMSLSSLVLASLFAFDFYAELADTHQRIVSGSFKIICGFITGIFASYVMTRFLGLNHQAKSFLFLVSSMLASIVYLIAF